LDCSRRLLKKTALLLQKQGEKAVNVIQDVVTRWWSTFKMCERLIRLKSYIQILIEENSIDRSYNLSESQWTDLSSIASLLQPFMKMQEYLEAEKYVTISCIPVGIYKIRKNLKKVLSESDDITSETVKVLAKAMLDDLNIRWGSGLPGTVYNEHITLGPRQRAKGLPLIVMIATLLDPRTKFVTNGKLLWMNSDDDTKRLNSRLKELLIAENSELESKRQPSLEADHAVKRPRFQGATAARSFLDDDASDDETEIEKDAVSTVSLYSAEAAVDAEILQYQREEKLPDASDPLLWWKINSIRFPLHSRLARKILAVPATSAPSERLFSSAGLTISSERSRLTPDIADALLFTRGVWKMSEEAL